MESTESEDFSAIQGALASIGLSALVVIGGSVLSQLMGFGTRIIMTRFLPVNGYGNIVLGITTLNILAIVSIIGLGQALSRYLPRAETKKERAEITAAIYHLGGLLSVVWGLVGFFGAGFIAGTIFDQPEMVNVIRVFSLTLPFYVLFKLSLKGIQGEKQTIPNVTVNNIVLPLTRILAVGALALSGFGVMGLAIGYNLGFILSGIIGFILFLRIDEFEYRSLLSPAPTTRYKGILMFSLPLALNAGISVITQQADVVLLGILGTNDMVAIYDIVFLISQTIMFFAPALGYLFEPLVSEYHSDQNNQKMGKLYSVVTRWMVIATFPIFALLTIAPESTLGTFFGSEYRAGGLALIILSIGYFISRLVGLSGSMLVASGATRAMMYISVATAGLNIILNLLLIPQYGILGAALATAGAIILNNTSQAVYVYKISRIHPFKRELVLPTVLIFVCLAIVKLFLQGSAIDFPTSFGLSAMLGLIYLGIIAATQSVYEVELRLLDSLFEQIGITLNLADRLSLFTRS